MAKKNVDESPMMKQFRELKEKYPEALLLFRCGDFYETYEDDAKVAAKVLGITLTWRTPQKRHAPGDYTDAMAGFPHHALDTYLPKLVRYCNTPDAEVKRIAICDQLPEPPKPTVKRDETESETNNENLKSQISNLKIQKNTTMAQNVKAADLIGKVIIVGNNQGKIIVKSVQDNGMLACEFSKAGDTATTPLTVTMPNLQKMTERGLWKMNLSPNPSPKGEGSEVTTEADVAEVDDIMPKVTKKDNLTPNPSPKGEGNLNGDEPKEEKPAAKVEPIGKPKQEKPKAKTRPSAIKHQTSKYVYSTYQTSKGKTGAKITGVSETDAAYQQAAAIHASGSYTKDKDGNKHFYLCFGPRYAEAAKKVCELLNAGKPIEDAIAVVNAATEERAVKREEWKQKREERKAQKNLTPNPSPKGEGSYSDKDVADMLKKIMAGGDIPEDIKALLAKAA